MHQVETKFHQCFYLICKETEEVQDLYTENYKTYLKQIREALNKWKTIPCSWSEVLILVDMAILPTLMYRFNIIPIKILAAFFGVQELPS